MFMRDVLEYSLDAAGILLMAVVVQVGEFFSYFLFSSAGGIIVKFGVTKFNCCTKFPS